MECKEQVQNLLKEVLKKFQVEQIVKQIDEYEKINEEAENPVIKVCPKCGQVHPVLIKSGCTRNGKQLLRCKTCNKRFVSDSGQLTFYSHQDESAWISFIDDQLCGVDLNTSAYRLGVHISTAFRMRHKLLHALEMLTNKESVEDVVEMDEKYIAICHKGTLIKGVKPRKHGSNVGKAGLSNRQACIMTAVSRNGNAFIHAFNMGKPKETDGSMLCQHVSENSFCFTDGIKVYDKGLKKRHCDLKHLKLEDYTKVDHLNNVNHLHSIIEKKIIGYRNIASKYINRYNALFMIQYKFRTLTPRERLLKVLALLRQQQDYFFIREIHTTDLFGPLESIFAAMAI